MAEHVVLRVGFEGITPRSALDKIVVRQKFGNHTLVNFEYRFWPSRPYGLPTDGAPFQAVWGDKRRGTAKTYGYVNHYDSDHVYKKSLTEVVGLGTSQRMNENIPTTWNNTTYSGIARSIGKRHGFRTVVHPHPYVLDSWSTGTRSDFVALNDLADEAGYRVWVDGSTMYFLDVDRVLRSASTMAIPSFRKKHIRKAKVMGGRNAPREDRTPVRRRNVHGLDQRTNEFFTVTGGNREAPNASMRVSANTYSEAKAYSQAYGQNDDTMYSLHATVDGHPGIYPGGLIRIVGHEIADDQEGVWMVTFAEHTVSRRHVNNDVDTDFVTEFIAVRNTKFGSPIAANKVTTVKNARPNVGCVLRDKKKWEAEFREHVNV